jgi:hypothetical protein
MLVRRSCIRTLNGVFDRVDGFLTDDLLRGVLQARALRTQVKLALGDSAAVLSCLGRLRWLHRRRNTVVTCANESLPRFWRARSRAITRGRAISVHRGDLSRSILSVGPARECSSPIPGGPSSVAGRARKGHDEAQDGVGLAAPYPHHHILRSYVRTSDKGYFIRRPGRSDGRTNGIRGLGQ